MTNQETQRLPEAGEIVFATVKEVTNHGAYVSLDEYNDITGFLHISEIATGWIRNIERYVKAKQKAVLKVIRVNTSRVEVDLSLKQVSGEEKKAKLIDLKKNEKATAFMSIIQSKLNLTNEQLKEIEEKILQKYDYIYDLFENVARKGIGSVQALGLSEEMMKAIEEESEKIQIPRVEIRGILEVSIKKPEGIDIIKTILSSVEGSKNNAIIKINYIAAPRYRIVVTAENFKIAEKVINNTVEKVKSAVEKHHGIFNFIRQESKKTHQE